MKFLRIEKQRFKLLAIFGVVLFWLIACGGSDKRRLVIADSKKYEASLFRQNCAICHGPEADGRTLDDGTIVPNLRRGPFKYQTGTEIYDHIAYGGNGMTPFRYRFSEREIKLMVEFVQQELRADAK